MKQFTNFKNLITKNRNFDFNFQKSFISIIRLLIKVQKKNLIYFRGRFNKFIFMLKKD